MLKVVVLGNGNVAAHLCVAFEYSSSVLLLQNYNRKGEKISNCNVSVVDNVNDIVGADVYVVTYSDNSLSQVYNQVSNLRGIVVHTSGANSMQIFDKFKNFGVFYPLYSFSKNVEIDFSKVAIAVEANTENNELILQRLAKSITNNVYNINSEQRKIIHIAAVFVNNFTNFMFSQAKEICDESGVDFKILQPLIHQTAHKIDSSAPQLVQTGPAIRKDSKTIDNHLAILDKTNQKEIYSFLTEAIQKYYEEKL